MLRSRVGVVALIVGLSISGIPPLAPAGAKVAPVVERTVAQYGDASVRPTPTQGAAFEPAERALPINANLVAISFTTASVDHEALEDGLSIEARFRTRGGWTHWQRLVVDPDEAPDPAEEPTSSRVYTAPLWVGTADHMRLRIRSAAGGPSVSAIRTHVINSLGNADDPGLLAGATAAFSRVFRGSAASAYTSTPSIITRAGWGADESWRECCPKYADNVHLAFVHHTAGTNSYSRSESPAIVRAIYRYHTGTRGWSDIGYNFLVDRYGQVFEGRYGGVTNPVIGAHTKGFNTGSTGVSLMGTFTTASPTSAMVGSLQRLLAWKLDWHHAPPVGTVTRTSLGSDKYPAGTNVKFNRISGHRDGQLTTCPGARVYNLLPQIRENVGAIGLPKLYLPTVSPLTRPDGDGVAEHARFRATFTTTINWRLEIQDADGIGALRTFTGRGTSMDYRWNGRLADGTLVRSARLRYLMTGKDDAGRSVRSAAGTFIMVTDHPDGTVLRSSTQTVYIQDGKARRVPTTLVRDSWFRSAEPVTATNVAIDRIPDGTDLAIREGTLLRRTDGSYAVFSGGKLRAFSPSSVYTDLGYAPAAALAISDAEAGALSTGSAITGSNTHPQGAVVRAADGTLWQIGDGVRSRIPTDIARRSWYRDAEVVAAKAGDLLLAIGSPITYREGTLFVLGNGSRWIYSDGLRRGFDEGLFEAMGYASAAALSLSNSEASSIPSTMLGHYPPPGRPIAGDWDDDGDDTPGAVRGHLWYTTQAVGATSTFRTAFGSTSDRSVAGDWNEDGADSPGAVRAAGKYLTWYLNNGFDGTAETVVGYGLATDRPVAGDWDDDGRDSPGVVRAGGDYLAWYLNDGFDGTADTVLGYGLATDRPVAGDWDGDGDVTPGVVRVSGKYLRWYLNNDFDGTPDVTFTFGLASDVPLAGDWDANGTDSAGVVRAWTWILANQHDGGEDLTHVDEV